MNRFCFILKAHFVAIIACYVFILSGCFHDDSHVANGRNDTVTSFQYDKLPVYDSEPYVTEKGNKPLKNALSVEETIRFLSPNVKNRLPGYPERRFFYFLGD